MNIFKSKYFYFLGIGILYVLVNGYAFNTGDQAEHLPQLYQKLDGELFTKDFFLTYYNATFTVRYYFVYFMYGLAQVFSVKLACVLVYAICLYAAIAGVYFIFKHFLHNDTEVWITVLFYLFLGRNLVIGGNYFQDNMLVGTSIAEAFCIWGFVLFVRDKVYYAALLLGIATLFQPLIGLQSAFIIACGYLIDMLYYKQLHREPILKLLAYAAIYGCLAAIIVLPIALKQINPLADKQQEANQILYEYRGALHYLPQLFPIKDYVLFGIYLMIGVAGIYKQTFTNKTLLLAIIGFIVVCTLAFAAYLLLFPYANIGKVQWFKTTVWLSLLATMGFTRLIAAPHQKTVLFAAIVAVCLLASVKTYKHYQANTFPFYSNGALEQAHEWIASHTPKNSLFLVAPNNYSFNCEAKRSTAINYKALVHETDYLLKWKAGMEQYYGIDFAHIQQLNCLPEAVNGFYRQDFKRYGFAEIDYILLNKELIADSRYTADQVCYSNTDYVLLKMK